MLNAVVRFRFYFGFLAPMPFAPDLLGPFEVSSKHIRIDEADTPALKVTRLP